MARRALYPIPQRPRRTGHRGKTSQLVAGLTPTAYTEVNLAAAAGTATFQGGTATAYIPGQPVNVTAASGSTTFDGGDVVLFTLATTLEAADGTTTLAGGTASLSITVAAVTGSTTFAGGTATFTGGNPPTNLTATGGSTTFQAGTIGLAFTLTAASSTYQARTLALTPSLYWRMSEQAGGTAGDSSGNNRTGTGVGFYTQNAAPLIAGDIDGGGWFQTGNSTSFISGVRADTYKPYASGSQRTFTAWIAPQANTPAWTVFAGSGVTGGPANAPHPTLELFQGDTPGLYEYGRFYATVNTFPVGWVDFPISIQVSATGANRYHLAFTFNDATGAAELFQNGVSLGTFTIGYNGVPLHWDTNGDPGYFQIGYRGDGSATESADGWFDEVAIFETILTPAQILQLYNAGARGSADLTGGVANAGLGAVRQLGAITVTTTGKARPVGLARTRAQGAITITGRHVTTTGLTRTRAQGIPKLSGRALPAGIARTRAQGSPSVNPVTLSPGGQTHTRAQGAPAAMIVWKARPAAQARTRALGAPTAHGHYNLAPAGLARTRAQGRPILSGRALPASITHARGIAAPHVNVINLHPAAISRA